MTAITFHGVELGRDLTLPAGQPDETASELAAARKGTEGEEHARAERAMTNGGGEDGARAYTQEDIQRGRLGLWLSCARECTPTR
jgi:hypothetical protein